MRCFKRTLCAALALCLTLALLPPAFAAETDAKETGHSIVLEYNDPNPVDGVSTHVVLLYTDSSREYTLPEGPSRPGFVFLGWVGEDGTVYQPEDTVEVSPQHDYKFSAQWEAVHPFTDLTGEESYFNDVMYLLEKGIMNGTSDSTFTPDGTFTRAMLWTVLARINGVDTDGGETWYEKACSWAMAEGITDGSAPQRAVSVQELATMLYRQAGEPEVSSELYGFKVADWARDGLNWSLSNKLVDLRTSNDASAVFVARGELAAALARFCKLTEDSPEG